MKASSEVILKQAEQALADVRAVSKQGNFPALRDVRVEDSGVVPLTADEKGPKAQRIALTCGPEGDRNASYIYVAGCRNHFVKLRFTHPVSSKKEAEAQLAALTKWLGEALQEKEAGAQGR
jgi:hypothetical protein